MANIWVLALIVPFISFFLRRYFLGNRRYPPLPPGPKPLPIVGNIRDLPPKGVPEYQHWLKYKDAYGPIFSLSVMGRTFIIIHGRQVATDLMEKMSLKTSGRANMEFGTNLCGFGGYTPLLQYDNTHRTQRKFLHQHMGSKSIAAQFDNVQELEARRFLLRVLNGPDEVIRHLRNLTGTVLLKVTYGYTVDVNEEDPLVSLVERSSVGFKRAFSPGAWLVDVIPALKYLPDGFPGTAFKETARLWKRINQAVVEIPYSFALKQMASGCHRPSYVSKLVQQCSHGDAGEAKLSHDDEHSIKWTAATLYAAGLDTISLAKTSFILAMMMFPEVQRKAQEEIDRVVGSDRLPQVGDRDHLPYIEGVVKEALRWCPALPMGFPHTADEDITYNGYLIPKGAYLLPAAWWLTHDPDVYKDPDSYDPERYLKPRNEPDPDAVFGFGRRVCSGRYFAEAEVFITIAQMLAAFNISKSVDAHGREMDVKLEVSPGASVTISDFPYKIVPRDAKKAELIQNIELEQPREESDAGLIDGVPIME